MNVKASKQCLSPPAGYNWSLQFHNVHTGYCFDRLHQGGDAIASIYWSVLFASSQINSKMYEFSGNGDIGPRNRWLDFCYALYSRKTLTSDLPKIKVKEPRQQFKDGLGERPHMKEPCSDINMSNLKFLHVCPIIFPHGHGQQLPTTNLSCWILKYQFLSHSVWEQAEFVSWDERLLPE